MSNLCFSLANDVLISLCFLFMYDNFECYDCGCLTLAITVQPLWQCPLFLNKANIWLLIPVGLQKCYQHQPQKGLITVFGCEPPLALSENTPIDLMRRVVSCNTNSSQKQLQCPVNTSVQVKDASCGTPSATETHFPGSGKSPRLKDQSEKLHRGRRLIEQEKHRGREGKAVSKDDLSPGVNSGR